MGDKGFNPNVHGARGLFSAMVFVYHVHNSGLPTLAPLDSSVAAFALGSMKFGVELFFGISGLVIVGALARASSPAVFAWDRVARIFPTLWAALLAITLMALVANRELPPPGLWLANFLAPPPFFDVPMVHPAAWSLGYEITFYLFCALVWFLRGLGLRSWRWYAWVAGTVLILLFPRAILMAAGVLIASSFPLPRWAERLARYPLALLILFLAAWRAIDIAADDPIRILNPLHTSLGEWIVLAPWMFVAGIVGGIGLLGIERGHGLLGRFMRRPVMQWLGTISYSFYLWHPICMAGVKFVMTATGADLLFGIWAQIAFLFIALPPSLLVSAWSQKLLEGRATRWLRRLGHSAGNGAKARLMPAPAMRGSDFVIVNAKSGREEI